VNLVIFIDSKNGIIKIDPLADLEASRIAGRESSIVDIQG
jgi:hypothetical protein